MGAKNSSGRLRISHLPQRLAVDVDLMVHVEPVVLQKAATLRVGALHTAHEAPQLLATFPGAPDNRIVAPISEIMSFFMFFVN